MHQLLQNKEGEPCFYIMLEQTVQQFVTCLRQSAKDCDFGADKDNQIRDAVLSRCNSEYVSRKLSQGKQELIKCRNCNLNAM